MMVLLVLSVLAVAIILAKLFQFARSGLRRSGFVESAVSALHIGQSDNALEMLLRQRSPVARVMESAVRCEIGRASWRERVFRAVSLSAVAF